MHIIMDWCFYLFTIQKLGWKNLNLGCPCARNTTSKKGSGLLWRRSMSRRIGNVSSFRLRLNPSNEPSSSIAPYQPVYRILKFVETNDEEYIWSLENECEDNRLIATNGSNILRSWGYNRDVTWKLWFLYIFKLREIQQFNILGIFYDVIEDVIASWLFIAI